MSSDIQVNRSADAGNKISIYCAVEVAGWRRGKTGAQNRKRKDVLFIQFQKTGAWAIHLTRALNVLGVFYAVPVWESTNVS